MRHEGFVDLMFVCVRRSGIQVFSRISGAFMVRDSTSLKFPIYTPCQLVSLYTSGDST